jgi:hypothetical protein
MDVDSAAAGAVPRAPLSGFGVLLWASPSIPVTEGAGGDLLVGTTGLAATVLGISGGDRPADFFVGRARLDQRVVPTGFGDAI